MRMAVAGATVCDDLVWLLSDQLGVVPSQQTRQLHTRLLRPGSP
jgi:hypothetical protein